MIKQFVKMIVKMNARQARTLEELLAGEAGRLSTASDRDTFVEVGQHDFGDETLVVRGPDYSALISPGGSMTVERTARKEVADVAGEGR